MLKFHKRNNTYLPKERKDELMMRFNRMDDQQAPKKREEEQRLAFSPALSAGAVGGAAALRPQSTIRPQASVTPSKAPQAPRENPYEPLVQLAKQLPANTPAHQLAQRPVTTRREGINLYNALSPKLDSHRRRTVDHYFASLAGQKLKNIGIPRPPQDLTDRLSQVWLGQNPEENARTIMKKYPYSQGVLEEVMGDRDASPTLGAYAMEEFANHGMSEELEAVKAGKRANAVEPFEKEDGYAQDKEETVRNPYVERVIAEKESALTERDKLFGIKAVEKNGVVYYDYTQLIDDMLTRLESQYGEKRFGDGSKPSMADIVAHLDDYLWFAKQVNHNTALDVKTDEAWQKTFEGIRMPAYDGENNETFLYHGTPMTREDLGNMLYGYLGSVLGINDEMLYVMGGMAKGYNFEEDDVRDYRGVEKGVNSYYER